MPDVVLVEPEIPQNTGNIGRTCVATGSKLWLVRPLGFRLEDRLLRRAGLDYWQHLDVEVLDGLSELLDRMAERRLWLFTKNAKRLYTAVQYGRDDVLVFGKETRGLPKSLLASRPESTVLIPIRDQVRSLNLASAVAVGVYEFQRQVGWGMTQA